jgi:tyrosyl-DNA phosphodiesterase-1
MESPDEPSRKRRRLSQDANEEEDEADTSQADCRKLIHESLTRPVSPPPLRRLTPTVSTPATPKVIPSPFQLTSIRDLPPASNVDAVTLKDILGDPLISECWEFNYLHDLDFLMNAFDEDIRGLVKVHVVHGFWKNEDESRLMLLV